MIEQQSLRGTALYNPHLHGKDELVSLFVARRELLALLVSDLRATASGKTPQHHLILGQRGMGKTMLLRRLAFAIEDDPALGEGWLALTFPEEQYNIARLSDFWLNCADALSDLLESKGRHAEAEQLDAAAEALRSLAEEARAKRALALLVDTAKRINRRLVLLVDNVDLVLDRVSDQEWTLREVLSSQPALVLIGASANAIESSFTYSKAFYDFFRVHELGGLSLDETRQLLVHYAETWNAPEVKRVTEQESARIKVLHNLTGGNPRTVVLLFNVLAAGVDGDVRTDLERLLDQCTPLYKARFEALPPQAQQVVHALAVHWDPTSAGELAPQLQMDVNAVSSQLARLVRQGVVEKVAYDPETKTGFQVAERFFNIWYLMRASRRVRRRLVWLVEFLKMFYTQDELRARALSHIQSSLTLEAAQRLRHAEYGFALADSIHDPAWRGSLERSGLHTLMRDEMLRGELAELLTLDDGSDLSGDADLLLRLERARSVVASTPVGLPGWSGDEFWMQLKESLLLPLQAKAVIAERLSTLPPERLAYLKTVLDSEPKLLELHYACPQAVAALATAMRSGIMRDAWDSEGAAKAETVLCARGLQAIALSNQLRLRPTQELMALLEQRIESTPSPQPWLVWLRHAREFKRLPQAVNRASQVIAQLGAGNVGVLSDLAQALIGLDRYAEAEAALRQAISIDGRDVRLLIDLGTLLARGLHRDAEAAEVLRQALDLDPRSIAAWLRLGDTFLSLRRYSEAIEAFRRALALESDRGDAWSDLGAVLARIADLAESVGTSHHAPPNDSSDSDNWTNLAFVLLSGDRLEQAYEARRKALEFEERAANWLNLGAVAFRLGDLSLAEEACRRALEHDGRDAAAWLNLARVLHARRCLDDAERAYRRALRLAPRDARIRAILAWFLLLERGRYGEAERVARSISATNHEVDGIMAIVLTRKGEWMEAARRVRAFIRGRMDQDVEGKWPRTLAIFREAVRAGRAREALEILEDTGVAERWWPLRASLQAVTRGGESCLRRVAPEVRGPAVQILAQLMKPGPEAKRSKRPSTKVRSKQIRRNR